MDSKSDFRQGQTSVVDISGTEVRDIPGTDKKKASKTAKGKMHPKDDIVGWEDRRRLALERHIKRKRRRRPYVKRKTQLDATEQPFSKNLPVQEGKKEDVPGILEKVEDKFEVEAEKDSTNKQLASADCREVDNGLNVYKMELCHVMKDNINEEAKEELSKGDAGNEKRQKVEKLNKLLENLLTKMKWETIIKAKVEKELKSRCEEKLSENEKEGPSIIVDEKEGMETSWRDKDQKIGTLGEMEKGNLLDDRHLEKLTHTGEKERTKATDSGSRMFEIREDDEDDDEDDEEDDDDCNGFMPRKLFFFSFDHFKREEPLA